MENLVGLLDAFFDTTGYHANVNVLNRETLLDAMEHPEKYPSLTIRVSGYAVNFVRLTREQQLDVINRTFHGCSDHYETEARPILKFRSSAVLLTCACRSARKVDETDIRSALESGDWGFVHSFQTGSGVDGPGVRIVAWLSGCQFRCVFCHNPDTWKLTNGMPVPLSQAVEVVGQYRHSLRTMKGGLTISGGEPLVQHRFALKAVSQPCKNWVSTPRSIQMVISADDSLTTTCSPSISSCSASRQSTPDLHREITGMDHKPVHEFARRLAARKRPVWIRFVIVPGYTDNIDEVGRMADFAAELGNVEHVDVLPFFQLGRYKWEKLGMDYKLRDAKPPSREKIDEVLDRFRAAGLSAA